MLGVEFPLFAFSHCRDVVAAVSRAGGFGVLGGNRFTPETLAMELSWLDAHLGGKPYGLDQAIPENIGVDPAIRPVSGGRLPPPHPADRQRPGPRAEVHDRPRASARRARRRPGRLG
jgi:hypothetical protein